MTAADVTAVRALAAATFDDLDCRRGVQPSPSPDPSAVEGRLRHLLETDAGGALVAERVACDRRGAREPDDAAPHGDDARGRERAASAARTTADSRSTAAARRPPPTSMLAAPAGCDRMQLVGAAVALVREGVWGLSLLVVRPGVQSLGIGRRLLAYGADRARGWLIVSSDDPRAMRAYVRAGFALHPTVAACGVVARPARWPVAARIGSAADLALTAAVDRVVRGGARPHDIATFLSAGYTLLVVERRGYAVLDRGTVKTLAALDDAAARDLVRAAAAATPEGGSLTIDYITGAQQWAVDVALELGLELRTCGPLMLRGELGAMTPYLPSGSFL